MHFFEKIGIRIGQMILDYGCGRGDYTIPLARAIGNGMVYAMDRDKQAIEMLKKEIFTRKIGNIRIIYSKDRTKIPLGNRILDVVFLYDLFNPDHFSQNGRERILFEANRVLKHGGLLSVYPKQSTVSGIKKTAAKYNFLYEKTIDQKLVYDPEPREGTIINFRKVDAF